jgi:hypothetical protein
MPVERAIFQSKNFHLDESCQVARCQLWQLLPKFSQIADLDLMSEMAKFLAESSLIAMLLA